MVIKIIINFWVMMVTLKNNIIHCYVKQNGGTAKRPEKKTVLAFEWLRNPRVKVLQVSQVSGLMVNC